MPAGSLALYRLHARNCPHRPKGRRWTRCTCSIWVQGSLGGKWVKKSLSTRDWSVAAATIHEWEAAREIGGKPFVVPTISEALQKYFDDAEARHLAPSTIRKRRELLNGKLLPYCKSKGLEQLKESISIRCAASGRHGSLRRLHPLSVSNICAGSSDSARSPNGSSATLQRRSSRHGLRRNPHCRLKRLKSIASWQPPINWLIGAPSVQSCVRWSCCCGTLGLRIQDAACLERSRLKDDKLFLYTQKTGTPVNCPLPPETVNALEGLRNERAEYFFWDGKSERETTVKSWNRVFQKLFAAAAPPVVGGHAHRFRDTFAISLLLKGVDLANVSVLLGHSSIKVTERHYSPWVKARQEQLEADVRRTWVGVSGVSKSNGAPSSRSTRRRSPAA